MRLLLNKITGLVLILTCCFSQNADSQCTTPVNIFPYTEGFETTNGNWTSGGTASDWAWGTPNKTVITGAATGTKCWIAGGLTGGSYNNGERSWLQSPCFDFTALQYPHISFNVFWETEQRFDGATFEYSTDLGATWANVGWVFEGANCLNDNWFNNASIVYISPPAFTANGWSGNIQSTSGSCLGGEGSGGWLSAKHTLINLAGQPNVIFRFVFGAGTQCNAYDGFAVDDIVIGDAPPNNASFTWSCTNNNTVVFTNTSALCPTGTAWDFGDPASGANNTSSLPNPTHIFSGPGQYTVTLTATGPGNAPSTFPQTINILGVTTAVTGTNNCAGENNGSITANVIPAVASPLFYNWNTVPAQTTQTISGLGAGTYTVNVSALNSCAVSATETITAPAALSHTVSILNPGCGIPSGTATITESGGTPPYAYLWSPYGGSGSTATGLIPGNYTVTVTDSKGCFENIPVSITNATPPAISIINKKDAGCFGLSNGAATAQVTGGTPPFSYSWNTVPAQTTATVNNLPAGIYTITVMDDNTCTSSATVQINEPAAGSCGDVYFPNAFTPNGDATNPDFGALGNLAAVSNYLLHIYNRYGELIFYTRDPYKKWDGLYKGKQLSGNYVWVASFTYKGNIKREEQGTVMIIR
ncbi:MAG: gliding motility-associated C-terminal domain-containing protein [Ferruginibacter sp.]|nr:gliding motility-associated C-terminal domain-containing protein [Ferruginibacter sp.]